MAQTPTTATLKPDRENSKNWDTTNNVFIEGDNLEVLKILQRHYYGKIKMIYIDPPYNTGKDFVYKDNFRDGVANYLEWTNQVNEHGKTTSNAETSGRFHSNWLNMMYPRLKLARDLLTEDGVIFVSIDDGEHARLKQLCDEIFGETNFIGTFVWASGRKNDSKFVSLSHEYILSYVKRKDYLKETGITWKVKKPGLDAIYRQVDKLIKEFGDDYGKIHDCLKQWYKDLPLNDPSKRQEHYSRVDEKGIYYADNISWPGGGGPKYEITHPVTGEPVKIPSGGWRFTESVMSEKIKEGRIFFGDSEHSVPKFKRYLHETEYEVPYSVFYQDGRSATKRLQNLFGAKVFDFPKDEIVLSNLVNAVSGDNDIILDFFAGSSTTAHSVLMQNVNDLQNRRYIMVQIPEPINQKTITNTKSIDNLAELSRARIDKAAQKIAEEFPGIDLDFGFRTYKLSDTNFVKWQVDSDIQEEDIFQEFQRRRTSIGNGALSEDLFVEVLLKLGFSLTENYTKEIVCDLEVFSVEEGLVIAYFNGQVKPNLEQLRALVEATDGRLIILEDAFGGSDERKTNLVQMCKTRGIELSIA